MGYWRGEDGQVVKWEMKTFLGKSILQKIISHPKRDILETKVEKPCFLVRLFVYDGKYLAYSNKCI